MITLVLVFRHSIENCSNVMPSFVSATITDLCNPNPCKNGGKCTFLPEKNDYICEDCPGRFTGKDCEGE